MESTLVIIKEIQPKINILDQGIIKNVRIEGHPVFPDADEKSESQFH